MLLSGAVGFCTGSRMWRWEEDWTKWLAAESAVKIPFIRNALEKIDRWKVVPDTYHNFLIDGFGIWGLANFVAAACALDGTCGVIYMPGKMSVTIDFS